MTTYKGQVYYDENDKVTVGTLEASTSVWYSYRQIGVYNLSVGASGATEVVPDANTIGGFKLDAATEYLYFNADVHSDWDGASDIEVEVGFEINSAGADSADTVDLQLVCYLKGNGDTATKLQTLENAITVGTAAQYTKFETVFSIDYDDGSNPVDVGDVMSMRLNLETDTSEIDDITINYIDFRYKTKLPRIEV